MDTFFRIIPSTPGVKEAKEWLKASKEKDTGIIIISTCIHSR
jgi:hypothetical protein